MKKVVSIFSVLLFLVTTGKLALAEAVPGALLYFDARINYRGHPTAWWNLGTVGGELSGAGNPPVLEEGNIAMPDLGIDTISKFYTHRKPGQCWGAKGDGFKLFLEDWTIELLLRMNSIDDSHRAGLRNQIAGFQPQKLEGDNAIRISFWWEPGEIGGQFGGARDNLLLLEEGEWTWINFVSGATVKILKNGRVRNLMEGGAKFDKKTPLEVVVIGANSYGERANNFSGSIALVRVYDRVLSKDEIKQNITAWAEWRGVDPASKLATTWGGVKAGY
ncbi:MAG: hypothetical protein OXT74_04095 [Candidatus Poribacteria bacterium]|nr:hypothetical protein [Candidatus Poribacteria bacterium]